MRRNLFFLLVLYISASCNKNKYHSSFQVSCINSITGQPMKSESFSLEKYKYGFTYRIDGEALQNVIATEATDEDGIAHFSDILLKEKKSISYYLSVERKNNYDFISNGNKIKIEGNPSGKTYYFTIEPVINKITIRPKDTTVLKHASFKVKAECMFISAGIFKGFFSKDDNIATGTLDSLNKEYTKANYPMGNYKIQIVRYQNNKSDTLNKDIYVNRNEDYLYEFEF